MYNGEFMNCSIFETDIYFLFFYLYVHICIYYYDTHKYILINY